MSKLKLLPLVIFLVLVISAPSINAQPESGGEEDGGSLALAEPGARPIEKEEATAGLVASSTPIPVPSAAIGEMQSPEDALTEDLELAAEARGWTLEEAIANYHISEIVGEIQGQITRERPDIFVGGALSEEPEGAPTLYIKGPADDYVRSLVAGAGIEIRIADNQPYSRAEMDERQMIVGQVLQDMGFDNAALGSLLERQGVVEVSITRKDGLTDDPAEVLARLPASMKDNVDVTFYDHPVAVDFLRTE